MQAGDIAADEQSSNYDLGRFSVHMRLLRLLCRFPAEPPHHRVHTCSRKNGCSILSATRLVQYLVRLGLQAGVTLPTGNAAAIAVIRAWKMCPNLATMSTVALCVCLTQPEAAQVALVQIAELQNLGFTTINFADHPPNSRSQPCVCASPDQKRPRLLSGRLQSRKNAARCDAWRYRSRGGAEGGQWVSRVA